MKVRFRRKNQHRFAEVADALERLERLHEVSPDKFPSFLGIDWPEADGGGKFTITYGDLAMVFRQFADQIEIVGHDNDFPC